MKRPVYDGARELTAPISVARLTINGRRATQPVQQRLSLIAAQLYYRGIELEKARRHVAAFDGVRRTLASGYSVLVAVLEVFRRSQSERRAIAKRRAMAAAALRSYDAERLARDALWVAAGGFTRGRRSTGAFVGSRRPDAFRLGHARRHDASDPKQADCA